MAEFPPGCCGFFGQVQAASSLNSLDDGFRTNLGTSAREIIFFCKNANLPDLSVGVLTAPTALHGKSSIKPFCLVPHSSVFITGLFPGGSDPSYLSFPKACPAMFVYCLWSRVLWAVSCTRVAPVFSRLVSCTLRVFSSLITASSCSSGLLCVSASVVTRSLVSGMRWEWHLENLYRCSLRNPTLSCSVQFPLV